MRNETEVRAYLRQQLDKDFELHEEVCVRHSLFKRRRLRLDLLAIPRDPRLSDIALAFETKPDREWDIPLWSEALKQASDYVLATVEPDLKAHAGKRVMAVFVYPSPLEGLADAHHYIEDPRLSFYAGMLHMAGYSRVGIAKISSAYREIPLCLLVPNVVWISSRGWRANARDILVGKRQLGSQRFPILEELAAHDSQSTNRND